MLSPMPTRIKITLAILFFLCLADMPYGYYQLVRFAGLLGFVMLGIYGTPAGETPGDDPLRWPGPAVSAVFQNRPGQRDLEYRGRHRGGRTDSVHLLPSKIENEGVTLPPPDRRLAHPEDWLSSRPGLFRGVGRLGSNGLLSKRG
jgi:hypothetical protein